MKIYNAQNRPTSQHKQEIIEFLFQHLDKYGDAKKDIEKAISYSLQETPSPGGFVMLSYNDDDTIKGAAVINRTGMGGYIPENILVYIATHQNQRGQGIGKQLMEQIINEAEGDIALHVEQDNPAKKLYEKFGFTNPYLEMRLKK